MKIRSIAFPLIGCGVGGFPVSEAGALMLDTILRFATSDTTVEEVTFALFTQSEYDLFKNLMDGRSISEAMT